MTTVGEAFSKWREAHGRSAEEADGARIFWVALGPLKVPVPHPGQLRWHDLHHLVLGYEPDLIGEMEISAFELRTGVKTPMVLLLCLAGVALGLIVAPLRTVRAWRRGRGRRNLYGTTVPWEELLTWPLTQLRALMEDYPQSPAPSCRGSRRSRSRSTAKAILRRCSRRCSRRG